MESPAKPLSEKAKVRRAALISAGESLFIELGYVKTNLDAILAIAGGSKRSIYDHFGGKEGLFEAVMQNHMEEFFAQLDTVSLGDSTLLETLTFAGLAFVELLLSPRSLALYRILVAETVNLPDLGCAFYAAGPIEVKRRLGDYFSQQVGKGNLRIDNIDFATISFLGMVKGDLQMAALLNPKSLPSREHIQQQVEWAVENFLRANASIA